MATVYYGRTPVEVCDDCERIHREGEPWEYAILNLDPFGSSTMHIEMDDGHEQPLCPTGRKAWAATRAQIRGE
jgi:hypothetical protein